MKFRLLFLLLLMTSQLQAYTDPGSGIMLWQILLAAFAGGLFYIRELFERIKGFFKKKTNENEDPS